MKMKNFGISLLLGLGLAGEALAVESPTLDTGRIAIGGYGDVGYTDSDVTTGAFKARFIPILLFQLNEKIHIETELEFSVGESGETETELEYADLHYFVTDRATVTAGKFLLPFGQFGPNLHPSWINRLPSAPGTYGGHGGNGLMSGVLPILTDHGVAFQYNIPRPGSSSKLFFDLYAVNGVGQEEEEHSEDEGETAEELAEPDDHGSAFPEIEFESTSGDNNKNKAIGGRIAFAYLPQLEVGLSTYRSKYDKDDKLDFNASALDLNWIGQFWSLRGEYVRSDADAYVEEEEADHDEEEVVEAAPEDDHDEDEILLSRNFNRSGWYLQTAWQLRQLGIPALNSVELVLRHSRTVKVDEGKRWTFGVNYWLTPSAAVKVAYEDTQMDDGRDDTRVFAQLSFGF